MRCRGKNPVFAAASISETGSGDKGVDDSGFFDTWIVVTLTHTLNQ